MKLPPTLFGTGEWALGLVRCDVQTWTREFLDAGQTPGFPVSWFSPKEFGRFYADPIPFVQDNRTFIAYEDYLPWTGKGRIAVAEITPEAVRPQGVVLEAKRAHFSYPFIFSFEGTNYCIPQTDSSDGLPIYRLMEPTQWELTGALTGVPNLIDPTLAFYDSRWWLFGLSLDGADEWLRIFWSASPLEPWTECAASPIRSDGDLRPAGPLVSLDGRLYRFSQDGATPSWNRATSYGQGIHVNEVLEISPATFKEHRVLTARAHEHWPFSQGFHTIAGVDNITCIDAYRRVVGATGLPKGITRVLIRQKKSGLGLLGSLPNVVRPRVGVQQA